LHAGEDTWSNRLLQAGEVLPLEPSGQLFHIQAEVNIPPGARLTFHILGLSVDLTSQTMASGTNPTSVADRIRTVEILVDRASIEAFANHGEISSTRFVLPSENGLSVTAEGDNVLIRSLNIYPLRSAWKNGDEN
jgi:fructan beta-fructosidase